MFGINTLTITTAESCTHYVHFIKSWNRRNQFVISWTEELLIWGEMRSVAYKSQTWFSITNILKYLFDVMENPNRPKFSNCFDLTCSILTNNRFILSSPVLNYVSCHWRCDHYLINKWVPDINKYNSKEMKLEILYTIRCHIGWMNTIISISAGITQ